MPKVLLYVLFLGPFVASITKLKNLNSSVLSSSVAIKSYVNDERTTMYTASYYYKLDGKTYNCVSSSSTSIRPDTKINLFIMIQQIQNTVCWSILRVIIIFC